LPQNVDFSLPWPLRVNPHLDVARARHLEWMCAFGLMPNDDQAVDTYLGWRLPEVAAFTYPEATAEGLCLVTDLMGWYFTPFDDQFDGPLGRDPGAVARVVTVFTDLLHCSQARDGASPSERAFADVWRRCQSGMSPAWRARTTYNWSQYFAVHYTEALIRCGLLPTGDESRHMWRRRRSISAYAGNDLGERAAGFEVPPVLWYSQTFTRMRAIAADVVTISNDTASLEKEERDGDHDHNLILLLQAGSHSRQEAITRGVEHVTALVEEFVELEGDAAQMARYLSGAEAESIDRYVRILQDWMRGNDEWERISSRYAPQAVQPKTPPLVM
jgi:hypothetical protein